MNALAHPAMALASGTRLACIDALRGLILLSMLIDHTRDTFFMHQDVADPVDYTTPVGLYLTRMITEPCAVLFIFLTGLSAWLYAQRHDLNSTRAFLFKRGLFLILLEFTLVDIAWSGEFPARSLDLQVIWCIGVSMIVLACLLGLSRTSMIVGGTLVIAGHNLLDGLQVDSESAFYLPWALLHERASFQFEHFPEISVRYPLLPWLGVIVLGYAAGPLYAQGFDPHRRMAWQLKAAGGLLLAFIGLRYLNVYGEKPWVHTGDWVQTLLSFKSATKYPPSLMYLLPSLAFGLAMLALLEKYQRHKSVQCLALYGGAPMFFYLLHLYALKLLYLATLYGVGPNRGDDYGFESLSSVWLCAIVLGLALYVPTRAFARLKQRRRDLAWLRYF